MSEVQFNNFAICDTCGVETLCRKTDGDDDECGACYWAPITHAKHQAELAALREELASAKADKEAYAQNAIDIRKRLTAAEQRNSAIVGKVEKCRECGSSDLYWFACNTNKSGVSEGRLRTHEITCRFVLGCHECSETLATIDADRIAERMSDAINPAESGASE